MYNFLQLFYFHNFFFKKKISNRQYIQNNFRKKNYYLSNKLIKIFFEVKLSNSHIINHLTSKNINIKSNINYQKKRKKDHLTSKNTNIRLCRQFSIFGHFSCQWFTNIINQILNYTFFL